MKKDIFEYKKETVAKIKFKSSEKEISLYNIQLLFNGKNLFENTVKVSELFSLLYPKTTYASIQLYTCGSICIPACANFYQEVEVFIKENEVIFKTNPHVKDKYQHFGSYCFDKKAFFNTLKKLKQEMDNDIFNSEIYDDLFIMAEHQIADGDYDGSFKYNVEEVQEININEYEFLLTLGRVYQKTTEIKQNHYDLVQKHVYENLNKKFDIFIKQKNGKFKKHQGYIHDIDDEKYKKEDFKIKLSEKSVLNVAHLFVNFCTCEEYFNPNLVTQKDYDEFNDLVEKIFNQNDLIDYLIRIKERKKDQFKHFEDDESNESNEENIN